MPQPAEDGRRGREEIQSTTVEAVMRSPWDGQQQDQAQQQKVEQLHAAELGAQLQAGRQAGDKDRVTLLTPSF